MPNHDHDELELVDAEADHDELELVDVLQRQLRDATEAELAVETEIVVYALSLGELGASPTTRARAVRELGRRHLEAQRRAG